MEFPHLNDTPYPNLDNVNVYQHKVVFDYKRWEINTTINLVNVIWDSDFTNVVKFKNNDERDRYFDSLEDSYTQRLDTMCRIVPDNSIKLPIPYDVMAQYNYLYIDLPVATSSGEMIDYERINGVRRWYFFIADLQQLAPNTTLAILKPDTWTNFINDVDITYMMLEKGHAPVSVSDTETYLNNPVENNRYLLAPDVNFDSPEITQNSYFYPFGNGRKYVCFSSTISPDNMNPNALGRVNDDNSYQFGNITYTDLPPRYGYQLQVNGFGMGNGKDYSNVRTPVTNNDSNGYLYNNCVSYCIEAENATDFFNHMVARYPSFFNTILACFVVSADMVELGRTHAFDGYYIHELEARKFTLEKALNFTQDDFNFPEEYRRFAKLYTFPYSVAEVSDNLGHISQIKIEETGTISVHAMSSLIYPYIDAKVYLLGIGGEGGGKFKWRNMNNNSEDFEYHNEDWFKYCFDMDIPTYALYVDGETQYMLSNFNRSVKNAINQALVNYHNSARQANTANANAIDANNMVRSNLYDSTANSRTVTANNNALDEANTNITETLNTANKMLATTLAADVTSRSNNALTTVNVNNNSLILTTAVQENEKTVATTMHNSVSTMATGAMSSFFQGSAAIVGMLGDISSGMSQAASASTTMVNAAADAIVANCDMAVITQTNSALAQLNIGANNSNVAEKTDEAVDLTYLNNHYKDSINTNNNNAMQQQHANTRNTNTANTTSTTNMLEGNADRTRNVGNANSNYTHEVAILNAKEILENAARTGKAGIDDARNSQPTAIGNYTGNYTADAYALKGIQIRVKTQTDSAIAQTASVFARYGYALNQIWDVRKSGLTLMKHFTYWKSSDTWIDDKNSTTDNVHGTIEAIFNKGVTIWSDPDSIGKVNVYDN